MSAEGVSVNCFGINLCHIDYSARKPFFCGSASLIQRLAYDRSQILSVSVLLSGDYNLKETVFKGFVFILLFRVLFLASCCVCNGTFLSFFFLFLIMLVTTSIIKELVPAMKFSSHVISWQ